METVTKIILNNDEVKESCTSLDATSIKKEFDDNIAQYPIEMVIFKEEHGFTDDDEYQIKEIKKEHFSSSDETISQAGTILGVKEEIVDIDDYSVSPELSNVAYNDANATFSNKFEDEPVDVESFVHSKIKRNRHNCTLCNYGTNRKDALTRHIKTHNRDNTGLFCCDLCPYSTIRKETLESHQIIHENIKPFKCKICERGFTKNKYRIVHMNLVHPEQCEEQDKMELLQCNKCSYNTVHRGNFASHQLLKHGDTKNRVKFSCPNCTYTTYLKYHMKEHCLTHSGEKPFVCKVCQFSTSIKANLKRHIRRKHNHLL